MEEEKNLTIEELEKQIESYTKEVEGKENFLHWDFEGWPITKKTLRELLIELGAKEENGLLSFNVDDDILDCYPTTLLDDGMSYGIDEMFFSDADVIKDGNSKPLIHFWRDKKWVYEEKEEKK